MTDGDGGTRPIPADESEPVRRDPERTRERILDAATREFSEKGLGGARVDQIAARADANKRLLYHYFGDKEALFLAVLERAYHAVRAHEGELHLADLPPVEGMRRLCGYTFDYLSDHPEFISLLNSENLHKARHLKKSAVIRDMHGTLVDQIADLLRRGEAEGVFRPGVDPVQLYISIAGLAYFYLSNVHTLSTIFGRDFKRRDEKARRHDEVVAVILGYLRP